MNTKSDQPEQFIPTVRTIFGKNLSKAQGNKLKGLRLFQSTTQESFKKIYSPHLTEPHPLVVAYHRVK